MLAVGGAVWSSAAHAASDKRVDSDLTIYVAGDLLRKGGVVSVQPLPVPRAEWDKINAADNAPVPPPEGLKPIGAGGKRMVVIASAQYSQIQFFYPEDVTYTFRFRPHPEQKDEMRVTGTRALSIGGVNSDTGLGPQMEYGFKGRATSGDQTIQLVAPDLDEHTARSLMAVVELMPNRPPLACETRSATAVCAVEPATWPKVAADWEKSRLDGITERKHDAARRACYDKAPAGNGSCVQVSADGAEPVYEFRRNP
ncbi:hypothetical protein [Azorhizobium oxalatiphilum]|uniref:hypothetical protein n=1 Tax=Azorhizobium oxalatiphilum TaxID=980631 RepID=UPI0016692487|nr:hypothetical protein [Azorhizobium oxalatiphilum]